IGANVKSIEGTVFKNCSLLTEIEFPEGLETIQGTSFLGCSFETLTFPKSLKSLTGNAFTKNENLKSVTFLGGNSEEGLVISDPHSVNSPFGGCNNLETVIMNEGVTKLESHAFAKLPALKNVQIPSTLTEIGNYAFYYCTALEEIEIPSSVEKIGSYAFKGCKNLKTVKLNEGLKTIERNAFWTSGIEELVIPSTVEKIGGQAFESPGLKKITFLGKDTPIGGNIPKNCVICGYTGSTAQEFVEKQTVWTNYTFEALDAQPTEEPAQEILLGDADCSGEVDILDVISINKAILGKENLSENGLKAIDFNGNEKPDSDEAMQVLKFIVGMIENFNA
ncbi:MAG: leucine-rich repeat protein, partial [Oscillospiraceae bacterium]|nr:leucine-rich repeat protein [Oscillospiraceae bacterium]